MRSLKRGKGAALEMSISTIVIIVIAMTMLILGLVLVRKIMCSGVVITDKISQEVENQIGELFNAGDEGIMCMGEGGNEVKLGGGGRRQVICIVNTDRPVNYKITNIAICSTPSQCTGQYSRVKLTYEIASTSQSFTTGKKTITVATLDIPKDISGATSVVLTMTVEKLEGTTSLGSETKNLILDVVPVSAFSSVIC